MNNNMTSDDIQSKAVDKINKIVQVKFSRVEIEEKKENYFTELYKLQDIESDFEDLKKRFKEKMKTIQGVLDSLSLDLKKGYKEIHKDLFLVPDMEKNTMLYLTEDGEIMETRDLRPEEKQLRFELKTGTDE